MSFESIGILILLVLGMIGVMVLLTWFIARELSKRNKGDHKTR